MCNFTSIFPWKPSDILLVNALARHRGLSKNTLALMFPGFDNKKVYERIKFLLKKGIITKIAPLIINYFTKNIFAEILSITS